MPSIASPSSLKAGFLCNDPILDTNYFTNPISTLGWQGDVYRFLVKALSLDPPILTFRYQPLVDRITSICQGEPPSGSSITGACFHAAAIANDTAGDSIVEWDGDSDVFDIRDPYLLFYLRWSEIIDG